MRKQFFAFTILSILLALAASAAQAQSKSRITAHVPFDFQVADKTLPAGDYTIKRLSQNTLLVQSADGERSVIAIAANSVENNPNAQPSTEKLVFRQYGDQRFLAQVFMIRGGEGRALNTTGAERNAAGELKLAQNNAKPVIVTIAAR